jgi:hypothetical protein
MYLQASSRFTSEGPVWPLTSKSQQIQRLAGNVHDLAVDPTPPKEHFARIRQRGREFIGQ